MTATLEHGTATRPWTIDPAHTEVEFSVRHLMISNVKGRFSNVSGSAEYEASNPRALKLDISVPIATIDTRVEARDNHLRSPDFFDAEHYPTMTFHGKRLVGNTDEQFKLVGDLTIRGVTREITLDVIAEGHGNDPWGNERIGYSATGKLDRKDYGLTWNQVLETGGVTVGDTVKITINTELMRPLQ